MLWVATARKEFNGNTRQGFVKAIFKMMSRVTNVKTNFRGKF